MLWPANKSDHIPHHAAPPAWAIASWRFIRAGKSARGLILESPSTQLFAHTVTITAPALAYSCRVLDLHLYHYLIASAAHLASSRLLAMPKGCFVSSGLTASPLRTAQAQTVLSLRISRRSQAHAGYGLPVRRLKPVGPCAGRLMPLVSCSAVVDRPPESELHSADLGWPRGFPSRYVLGDQLGRGSFGIVYLATDRVSGEEVAAKIIPKERKGTTRDHIIEKIQQEVDVLRRMQGRQEALKLLAVYEDDEQAYVITEVCYGSTLEHFLRGQGALTEQEAARVTHNIVSVLAECHRQHICYADVKPANFLLKHQYPDPRVLVDPSCIQRNIELRVADFGCSQHVNKGVKLNKKAGTPLYMAPELFMRHWGIESDMWALGMLLYQMLAGRMPFWSSGQQMRDPLSVMSAILSGDIDFAGEEWIGISVEAIDLCKSLLDRDYNTRISAAQTLAHPWLQEHCHSEEECVVVNDFKVADLDYLMEGEFDL